MRAMKTSLCTALAVAGLSLALGGNASAASSSCGAKYKAAKTAGTLGGQTYKSFKASQCASDSATMAPATSTAAAAPMSKSRTATPAVASGPATFPSAIDAKYAKDTPGKGREQTCLDQYHANKANNGNGGMKWIQKGGGYYSACSKKLKG